MSATQDFTADGGGLDEASGLRAFLRGFSGLLAGLAMTGVALVISGAVIGDRGVWREVLLALGGALLGASSASLISVFSERDFADEVRELLTVRLSPGFSSREADITGLRRRMHFYSVSVMDGERVWRYSLLDFSRSRVPGRLSAVEAVPDRHGIMQQYVVEASAIDHRFITVHRPAEGCETAAIFVYPGFGKGFQSVHCGIAAKESWDGRDIIAPAVLSRQPIDAWKTHGRVTSPTAAILDRIWAQAAAPLIVFEVGVSPSDES